jgi:hypothetical protein
MERALVVAGQQGGCSGLNHRHVNLLAGERLDVVDRVETHQRDERHLVTFRSSENLGSQEPEMVRMAGNSSASRNRW